MTDYTKTTNFLAKDSLTSGDPNKVIKGAEHDTEYNNIATAVGTKTNKIIGGVLNDLILQTADGDLKTSGWGMPNVSGDITSSHTELNLLDGKTLASSGNVIDNFPAGTSMLFQQTAAPTGWTKQTTHNDKGLRIVSGTAGSGGTDTFSTCFSASKTTEDHTLTIAEMPAHTHTGRLADAGGFSLSGGSGLADGSSGSTGGDGGHSHDITLDLQYVDFIIATKD